MTYDSATSYDRPNCPPSYLIPVILPPRTPFVKDLFRNVARFFCLLRTLAPSVCCARAIRGVARPVSSECRSRNRMDQDLSHYAKSDEADGKPIGSVKADVLG